MRGKSQGVSKIDILAVTDICNSQGVSKINQASICNLLIYFHVTTHTKGKRILHLKLQTKHRLVHEHINCNCKI